MDSFIKLFGSHVNIREDSKQDNIKKIYINNNKDYSGYGIMIDKYILTLHHVIEGAKNITINDLSYQLIFYIDEYDIAILSRTNSNIFEFIDALNYFNNNIIKIADSEDYCNLYFSLNNIDIEFKEISHSHIKTNLFPSIPVYTFNILDDIDYAGYSGHVVTYKDKYIGLIVMQKQETRELVVLPFDIISMLIKSYYVNDMKFYHLPIVLNDNVIVNHGFRTLMPHDKIISINGILLNDNTIFDDNLGIKMMYDTYILLNNFNILNVVYMRINKTKNKIYNTKIKLKELNYSNLMLNYREYNNNVVINSLEFSELSEEIIIDCIRNNINIPEIDYDKIYNKQKMIYIKNISNPKLLKLLESNGMNLDKNIYLLSKISGKKINSIKDINNFKKNVQLTVDLIDSNNNNIKIKIC